LKPSVLDSRSKLVVLLIATFLLMIFHQWISLTVSLGILAIMVLLLRLSHAWLKFLKGLGFPVLTFFIIAWVAFDLLTGIVSALRLLTIATVFFLFFQTTPPQVLSNALLKMGIPYPLTFVLSASMQFVPVLIHRARNIRDAQRARGIPIEGGLGTFLHLPALVGPLLIQAFKLADELAEAMEARGFGGKGRRFRHEPRFAPLDWTVVLFCLLVLIAVLWIS